MYLSTVTSLYENDDRYTNDSGQDKETFLNVKLIDFLTHKFKHGLCAQKNRLIETALFEYPQLMFWSRNMKNKFQVHTLICYMTTKSFHFFLYIFNIPAGAVTIITLYIWMDYPIQIVTIRVDLSILYSKGRMLKF